MRDRRRHTELSRNVPPFLTLQSAKKDPSVYSEYTPSHTDTPSIRSYSLKSPNLPMHTLGYAYAYPETYSMTDRIETHSSRFGGKVLMDEKLHDFFNVPKLHPTHRWNRPLSISVPVPS
jgi:hypothetical protein